MLDAGMTQRAFGRREHDWGLELTGFGRPFGLGVDSTGRLLVTDMDQHLLVRFDAALEQVEWHDGGSHGWSDPAAVRPDRIDAARPCSPSGWNGPHSVDFGTDDALYVTCYYDAAIHVLSPGGAPAAVLGRDLLHGPASALFDPAGRLMVAEYAQNAVLVLDTAGGVVGQLAGAFDRPHMARALADASIVVADTWNDRVRWFNTEGQPISGTRDATVARPVAIDPLPDGGLLVTAWGDDAVLVLDRDGSLRGRVAAPPLKRPYDARCAGTRVVIADSHHARVLMLNGLDVRG